MGGKMVSATKYSYLFQSGTFAWSVFYYIESNKVDCYQFPKEFFGTFTAKIAGKRLVNILTLRCV